MDYVMIFHANLNYAYLMPEQYEQTIRASYETIFDTFRERCPEARYTFEASGFTIEQIAALTPDVLEKLKDAVRRGQCEFMGSPYAHPMMANVPEEDGRRACQFAMQTYERRLGFRPESAWNPECSWMQYVPRAFRDAGFKRLVLDFESFMICNRPEYGAVERNPRRDMAWGGTLPFYELDPDEPVLHFPFKDVAPGLGGFCRSMRITNHSNQYFLGNRSLEQYMENVRRWSGTREDGALIIIADDAEYCGTTGYFYVKHYGDYDKCFVVDPGAGDKLEALIEAVMELGPCVTFGEACELPALPDEFYVEDRFAWHRTYADAWADTPEARRFQPIVDDHRRELKAHEARASGPEAEALVEEAWFHLTNSENSDGRWPPPPAKTCPFNVWWVWNEIELTRRTLWKLRELLGLEEEEKAARVVTSDEEWGTDASEADSAI